MSWLTLCCRFILCKVEPFQLFRQKFHQCNLFLHMFLLGTHKSSNAFCWWGFLQAFGDTGASSDKCLLPVWQSGSSLLFHRGKEWPRESVMALMWKHEARGNEPNTRGLPSLNLAIILCHFLILNPSLLSPCSLAVIYGHEGSRRKGEVLTWQDPRVKRLVKTSPLVYWHESDSWPALPVLSSGPPHGDNVWCFILEYSSRLTGRIWVILISSVLLLLGIEKGPKNQDT